MVILHCQIWFCTQKIKDPLRGRVPITGNSLYLPFLGGYPDLKADKICNQSARVTVCRAHIRWLTDGGWVFLKYYIAG